MSKAIDPRRAYATVEFEFEQDNFDGDLAGHEGPDNKRMAEAELARHARSRDPHTAAVMRLESEAVKAVERGSKLKSVGGYGTAYDDRGVLHVDFGVGSVADVRRLRAMFDRDGRSYNTAAYVTAAGLSVRPFGAEGPVYATDSSPHHTHATDLDDWLDALAPARRKAPARRRSR